MTKPAIEVHGLGKCYSLRESARRRVHVAQAVREAIGAAARQRRAGEEAAAFWALREVTFRVEQGEALGVIGHNGAGKSTLLRILSRLCVPTEGRALVRGRVGSLLDLNAGFHQELSGRENLEIKAVLLGMTRREARRRTEEIAEWAGVRRFLDQPIKQYSNGMRVRLAFSVAVATAPEILFIDEVIGVGDEEFKARSSERMRELIEDGRTVLIVSHSLRSVQELCDRAIRLDHGRLVDEGPPKEVVHNYLRAIRGEDAKPAADASDPAEDPEEPTTATAGEASPKDQGVQASEEPEKPEADGAEGDRRRASDAIGAGT